MHVKLLNSKFNCLNIETYLNLNVYPSIKPSRDVQ